MKMAISNCIQQGYALKSFETNTKIKCLLNRLLIEWYSKEGRSKDKSSNGIKE